MNAGLDDLPVVDGGPDAAYLAAALRRAGRPAAVGDVEVTVLTGGRNSNKVLSLKSDSARRDLHGWKCGAGALGLRCDA